MKRLNTHNRIAFTLVELLVVIALMGILSGMMTYAMSGARQEAREKRAKAEIDAMSSIVLQRLNEIYLQPIAFVPRINTGAAGAVSVGDEVRDGEEHNRVIMLARRDLARMSLPQCRADLMYPPARLQYRRKVTAGAVPGAVKVKEPSEWGEMRRSAGFVNPKGVDVERTLAPNLTVFQNSDRDSLYGANGYFNSNAFRSLIGAIRDNLGGTQVINLSNQNADWLGGVLTNESNVPWTREYESSECLYLILASTQLLGERALDQFSSRMIANLDGDAVPEMVDPWGVPYEFMRESPGLGSPLDVASYTAHPAGSDGNDFLRTDFRYNRLTPGNQLDDPFGTIPLIVSAGSNGEFGIRRTFNKDGDIATGTAGVSPAASISVVQLTNSTGASLPSPRSPGSYQYPDPFMSFRPVDNVIAAIPLADMTANTIRSWSGLSLGLGAVIDRDAAADNIYSTVSLGLDR